MAAGVGVLVGVALDVRVGVRLAVSEGVRDGEGVAEGEGVSVVVARLGNGVAVNFVRPEHPLRHNSRMARKTGILPNQGNRAVLNILAMAALLELLHAAILYILHPTTG